MACIDSRFIIPDITSFTSHRPSRRAILVCRQQTPERRPFPRGSPSSRLLVVPDGKPTVTHTTDKQSSWSGEFRIASIENLQMYAVAVNKTKSSQKRQSVALAQFDLTTASSKARMRRHLPTSPVSCSTIPKLVIHTAAEFAPSV